MLTPCTTDSLTAYTNGNMVAIDRPALMRSNRPGLGSFDSGIRIGPSTTSAIMTGMLIKKTEPHQKCSSNQPPTKGPAAVPPPAIAPQTPIASVR